MHSNIMVQTRTVLKTRGGGGGGKRDTKVERERRDGVDRAC